MRFRANWMVGMECALIAFILILISLSGTWFTYKREIYERSVEDAFVAEWTLDMGLTEFEWVVVDDLESTWHEAYVYAELTDDSKVSSLHDVSTTIQALLILALAFIIAMFIMAFLIGQGRIERKRGIVPGAFAIILTIVALAYFAIAFSSVMERRAVQAPLPPVSGFWGSKMTAVDWYTYDLVWGPGWSWYLVVLAFLILLIGTIALYAPAGKKDSENMVAKEEPSEI